MQDRRDIDDARQRDGAADRNITSPAGHGARERDDQSRDPRDVATRCLDLPRGQDRELIRVRERTYELNGSESRTLASVGTFRVVRTEDLRNPSDPLERRLKHLRDQGLIRSVSLGGRTRDVIVLTREGHDVLEARRREDAREPRQVFYEGRRKPREVTHDAALYRAYRRASDRLREQGADVRRVVLDYELKREYQTFLQECNRQEPAGDCRSRRSNEEVERWAREHDLP